MSNQGNLSRIVKMAVMEHGLDTFARYWDLYNATTDVSEIQSFYIRIERHRVGGYCNVAIVGDGLLVDIEGDDEQRSGGLGVQPLGSVTGVAVHVGSLPGLPHAQNATLVVVADMTGDPSQGIHWVAKTNEDEELLLQFASVLVKAVSKR